jgi:hypothetical protein
MRSRFLIKVLLPELAGFAYSTAAWARTVSDWIALANATDFGRSGEFQQFHEILSLPPGPSEMHNRMLNSIGLFSLVYRLQLWSIRGTIHLENDDS